MSIRCRDRPAGAAMVSDAKPVPTTRRRRRWPWIVLIGLAAVVAVPVVVIWHGSRQADRRLRETVERTDHLDPGWRWEDLESRRPTVPDEENSASVVLAARELLPGSWPVVSADGGPLAGRDLYVRLTDLPPEVAPDDALLAELREELARVAPALRESLKLVGRPRGRYPLQFPINPVDTLLPGEKSRTVAVLLQLEAARRSADGDSDGAMTCTEAMLNAARSTGDEPLRLNQLVRLSVTSVAVFGIERAMAQGAPSEAALARIQRLLEAEQAEPILLIVARGERALWHRYMDA